VSFFQEDRLVRGVVPLVLDRYTRAYCAEDPEQASSVRMLSVALDRSSGLYLYSSPFSGMIYMCWLRTGDRFALTLDCLFNKRGVDRRTRTHDEKAL
jgi:hypothetical protein